MTQVTQADRDAAADVWRDYVARVGECMVENAIRGGSMDDSPIVQAFATAPANKAGARGWRSLRPSLLASSTSKTSRGPVRKPNACTTGETKQSMPPTPFAIS